MALFERKPAIGSNHRSDRGVQYACRAYVDTQKKADARISMSAKGKQRDNAKAESFFKTLKVEEVCPRDDRSFTAAIISLVHVIEAVYNEKRLRSTF
jgi:putative transposase